MQPPLRTEIDWLLLTPQRASSQSDTLWPLATSVAYLCQCVDAVDGGCRQWLQVRHSLGTSCTSQTFSSGPPFMGYLSLAIFCVARGMRYYSLGQDCDPLSGSSLWHPPAQGPIVHPHSHGRRRNHVCVTRSSTSEERKVALGFLKSCALAPRCC